LTIFFLEEFDFSENLIENVPHKVEVFAEGGSCIIADRNSYKLPNEENIITESSRFTISWSEMIGRRPTMEDSFLIKGTYQGNKEMDLFGVFDGHAGSTAAKFAATHFPNSLKDNLEEKNPIDSIRDTFFFINNLFRIYLQNGNFGKNAGSTALITLILKNKIYVGNLGDTRAVLCRNGKAIRISVDHKPLDEEDRINALGGWVMNDPTRRINGLLAVSRSIGDFFMEPFVTTDPYIGEIDIVDQDEFLILACDGVWDEINDQDAVEIVKSETDLYKACSKLRDFAYLFSSEDNISVIVVKLK